MIWRFLGWNNVSFFTFMYPAARLAVLALAPDLWVHMQAPPQSRLRRLMRLCSQMLAPGVLKGAHDVVTGAHDAVMLARDAVMLADAGVVIYRVFFPM
jgi:hypothetical protein